MRADARDSSPYPGRFGGSGPGLLRGMTCGPPENKLARSIGGHDRMEDKKQIAPHRGRKPSKSRYFFVVVMNSSPDAKKVALDIRGINRVSTPTLTQM